MLCGPEAQTRQEECGLDWPGEGSLENGGQWEELEEAQGGQLGMGVCEGDPGGEAWCPLLIVSSKATVKPLDTWTCLQFLPRS